MSSIPDARLYTVRGFDSAARQFNYQVNPRFGSTQTGIFAARTPFRITLSVSMNVGPPLPQQQLERWVAKGRTRPGVKLTAEQLKQRYRRNVPDPYAQILEESDSLLLSAEQQSALKDVQSQYLKAVDSLWTTLTDYLVGLPRTFNSAEALKRQEATVDAVWEFSRLDVQRTLGKILSPVQLKLLPWEPAYLYKAKEQPHIRIFAG